MNCITWSQTFQSAGLLFPKFELISCGEQTLSALTDYFCLILIYLSSLLPTSFCYLHPWIHIWVLLGKPSWCHFGHLTFWNGWICTFLRKGVKSNFSQILSVVIQNRFCRWVVLPVVGIRKLVVMAFEARWSCKRRVKLSQILKNQHGADELACENF